MIIKLIINGFYNSFSPLISRYNFLLLKQRKSLEMTKKAPTELLLSWGVYYVRSKTGMEPQLLFCCCPIHLQTLQIGVYVLLIINNYLMYNFVV